MSRCGLLSPSLFPTSMDCSLPPPPPPILYPTLIPHLFLLHSSTFHPSTIPFSTLSTTISYTRYSLYSSIYSSSRSISTTFSSNSTSIPTLFILKSSTLKITFLPYLPLLISLIFILKLLLFNLTIIQHFNILFILFLTIIL